MSNTAESDFYARIKQYDLILFHENVNLKYFVASEWPFVEANVHQIMLFLQF